MSSRAVIASMQPIRDRRERVIAYAVSSCGTDNRSGSQDADDEALHTVEMVARLARFAGRTLVVPVTPALVRDGVLTRFASTDAVWLLATDALEDARTRRAVDRLLGTGFHFALEGYPDGEPLPPSLIGSTIVLDAVRTSPVALTGRVAVLLEAGLHPLIRGVDDRATRQVIIDAGASMHSGRLLMRGSTSAVDRELEDTVIRAVNMLAAFADGRPPDATFDDFVRDDPYLAAALLRALNSATLGNRGPRSVAHAMTMLGRDAVMAQLVLVAARLIGEVSHDPELAFVALRRARVCERVGAALDGALHPRARVIAGLLSTLEFALGVPPSMLLERLTLPPLLRDVLVARQQTMGRLLDVIDALEYGWWDDVRTRCTALGIAPMVVGDAWLAAWRSARDELGLSRADIT